ncbi:MAG TPA: SDR family NAD(P)-dependent oxidoreductase [Acidimicrobiia bacterium]|nr:SDR family NAD(P)-dependent oxidoreductase [Acidimicrobiia bacterium]
MRAIVTGGASGIGAATVEAFRKDGAMVGVIDRTGGKGVDYELDVRDGDAVTNAVNDFAQRAGGLNVLVNNAGTGDLRPLHMVDDKTWHRLIDVNLTGTFNGMRAAIPIMLEGGGGAIVNNASLSGLQPTRNEAAYSAAKAGVIALTKSGALEYGPTIRVNCVAPGHIVTPLTEPVRNYVPEVFGSITDALPAKRPGTAEEVAELIVFLASDRARYITGQTIVIDGGATLPQAGTDPALAELYRRFSNG